MELEHFILIAEAVNTDTVTWSGIVAVGGTFFTWLAAKVLEPGIKERREGRARELEARIKREDEESKARIEEMRQKRLDDKEANDKSMQAMEARGARETSLMNALQAVNKGQEHNQATLERIENLVDDRLKENKIVLKAILRQMGLDHDWDGDTNVGNAPPAGQQPTGKTG